SASLSIRGRITVAEAAAQPRPTISTHVLDTERGMPAQGVRVALYRLDVADKPVRMTQALTDADGRVRDLLERPLMAGDYRLEFGLTPPRAVDASPTEAEVEPFFRRVSIDLHVTDPTRSYHVPLLLAPFALTTYRGS